MFRLMHCVRKRENVSEVEFRRRWATDEFDALISEAALLFNVCNYKKSLYLHVVLNDELRSEAGGEQPYDAVIEYWWKDKKDYPSLDSPITQKWIDKLEAYQEAFIDSDRSCLFFTDWEEDQ